MFSSMASVSELNRGSSIYEEGETFKMLSVVFLFFWHINCVIMCTHYQPSVHTAAPQVWCVLGQIHRSQPLHDSVVGPLDHLTGSELVLKHTHRNTL